MKIFFILMFLLVPSFLFADSLVDRAEKDEVAMIPDDDPYMAEAKRHARRTLNEFLKKYNNPSPGQLSFSVKVGIKDGDGEEFFWVVDFKEIGGSKFKGIINNEPRLVSNVSFGQAYTFHKKEIVDWVYFEGEKMKGNFTACALLKHEPKEQQEEFRKAYGLECSI